MKIAIIDDNLVNAKINKAYVDKLQRVDSELIFDSHKGLEYCLDSANDIDMILLDYRMPNLDGLNFIQRFRNSKDKDDVPIVMITAVDEREVLREALALGANDFLTKPVDEIELRSRVRNMLKLRASNLELKQLATIDDLTNVFNRRHFIKLGDKEFDRSSRYDDPLTVAILDADKFKLVNDTYGHAGGDKVLKTLGSLCKQLIRNIDFIGRLGGEEFGICFPETECLNAYQVLDRLRQHIESNTTDHNGQAIQFTVSIGLAQLSNTDSSFTTLLDRADKALYQAKETGRNKVVSAT
jgi:two-component system, chemotaxis family, response regulator WspR